MPRVAIPPDVAPGAEVRLATGEIALVAAVVNASSVRVTLADGTQRIIDRSLGDIEQVRERSQQRIDKVQAFRTGYVRIRVRHYDTESRLTVSRSFPSQTEADAYAAGKQMFGAACAPVEIEP